MSTYISPFKLFNLSIDASDAALKSNKEYILQRIQHNNEMDLVHIQSSKMVKKDVIRLLNELDNFYTRQYHIAIFEHKKLLNFLEYGHLNYFRNNPSTQVPQDGEFLNFIAPYFGYQYSETLLQAIKTQDKATLTLLASATLPMAGNFEEQCYKHTNLYVEHTIKELQKLQNAQELYHMSERELLSYLPNRTIELYNMLPDYFYSARNLIGNEIYQLSVVLTQNFGRGDGASAMLKQGLKLKLDDAVRKNLEAMLQRFSLKSRVPAFIWIALAVVAALFALKYIETTFMGS